jgi:hypothetical protein
MPEGDSMDGGGRAATGSAAERYAISPPTLPVLGDLDGNGA